MFIGLIVLSSCGEDVIKAHGDVVSENRIVDTFHSVRSQIAANIYLSQDTEQNVRIETNENLLYAIKTYVSDGELIITTEHSFRQVDRLDIYLRAQDFNKINLTGSGNISSSNCMAVGDLEIRITGSGNVDLCGSAESLTANISGSGNFHAYDMVSNNVNAHITGSGDIRVRAEEKLDVNISGSGAVYYKGQPQVNSHISGSGKVINAN